jgi:hypothetical protein
MISKKQKDYNHKHDPYEVGLLWTKAIYQFITFLAYIYRIQVY